MTYTSKTPSAHRMYRAYNIGSYANYRQRSSKLTDSISHLTYTPTLTGKEWQRYAPIIAKLRSGGLEAKSAMMWLESDLSKKQKMQNRVKRRNWNKQQDYEAKSKQKQHKNERNK